MAQILDFGNGVVAGGSASDEVRIFAHSGLEAPEIEQALTQNAVLDGGVLGGARAAAREPSVGLDFANSTMTRQEILAAFTPGVDRVLSGPRGTFVYRVTGIGFDTDNLAAPIRAVVRIATGTAYVEGPLVSLAAGDATIQYTTIQHTTGTAMTVNPPKGIEAGQTDYCVIWQTFDSANANALAAAAGFYVDVFEPCTVDLYLDTVAAGVPSTTLYSESVTLTPGNGQLVTITGGPYQLGAAGSYAVRMVYPMSGSKITRYLAPYRDTAAGFASGVGGHRVDGTPGSYVAGDGTDTTIDWRFQVVLGVPGATTTVLYVDGQTEVPAPPVLTVTLGSNASSLTISDGTHTTTITDTLLAGDVIVIDSAAHTVTKNGANALPKFDRSGDWPMVYPGASVLTFSQGVAASISWRPRYMGML